MSEPGPAEVTQHGRRSGLLHGEVVVRTTPCLRFLGMAAGADLQANVRRFGCIGSRWQRRSGRLIRRGNPCQRQPRRKHDGDEKEEETRIQLHAASLPGIGGRTAA
jgi:hypothetical protein